MLGYVAQKIADRALSGYVDYRVITASGMLKLLFLADMAAQFNV